LRIGYDSHAEIPKGWRIIATGVSTNPWWESDVRRTRAAGGLCEFVDCSLAILTLSKAVTGFAGSTSVHFASTGSSTHPWLHAATRCAGSLRPFQHPRVGRLTRSYKPSPATRVRSSLHHVPRVRRLTRGYMPSPAARVRIHELPRLDCILKLQLNNER